MQKFFVFVEVIFLYIFSMFGLKETEAQCNKAISESTLESFVWNGIQNFKFSFYSCKKTISSFSPFIFLSNRLILALYSQVVDSLVGE